MEMPLELWNLKILSIVTLRTVREDQTGLTQGCDSSNNMRRLLNMVHLSEQQEIDGLRLPHMHKKLSITWNVVFYFLHLISLT